MGYDDPLTARPQPVPKPGGASRLLHAIVVVGASLGCGGTNAGGAPDAAGDASAGDDRPDDATGSLTVAPDPTEGAAPDASGPPHTLCDCARPGTYRCRACESGKAPIHGRCQDSAGIGCLCDESVAVGAPSDCPHPEQYVCAYSPDLDASTSGYGFYLNDIYMWYAFADCWCDSTRPVMASDCTCETCSLACATTDDVCPSGTVGADGAMSARVRYACACLPPPTPIR
jgi:hypothetical protein